MYVMIKANIAQFNGSVKIWWAVRYCNPTSSPDYWLQNLSAHHQDILFACNKRKCVLQR